MKPLIIFSTACFLVGSVVLGFGLRELAVVLGIIGASATIAPLTVKLFDSLTDEG